MGDARTLSREILRRVLATVISYQFTVDYPQSPIPFKLLWGKHPDYHKIARAGFPAHPTKLVKLSVQYAMQRVGLTYTKDAASAWGNT